MAQHIRGEPPKKSLGHTKLSMNHKINTNVSEDCYILTITTLNFNLIPNEIIYLFQIYVVKLFQKMFIYLFLGNYFI